MHNQIGDRTRDLKDWEAEIFTMVKIYHCANSSAFNYYFIKKNIKREFVLINCNIDTTKDI